MKKLVKLLIVFTFSLVACFSLFFGIKTYAMGENGVYSLHQQTRIYDGTEEDYISNFEKIKDYEFAAPSITVLTHGLGGNATHWSNNGNENSFENDPESLISKIAFENDYNIDVYVASCTSATEFSLEKYNWKLNSQGNVDRIQSVNNHIVLVFESSRPYDSNLDVYNEFDNVIDTVSLQYKALTGKLPLLNLVGHSRGGLTNIMYATKHPYNVKQIYSMGTPYNGSALGNIDFFISLLGMQDSDGAHDILNEDIALSLRDDWNRVYRTAKYMPNVVSLGAITSIEYARSFFGEISKMQQYDEYLDRWELLIKIGLLLVDLFPELGTSATDVVDGYINMTAFWDGLRGFFTNSYNLDTIYEQTGGDLTREELYKIVDLYDVINGEAVLLDDLFIDLNSQLGLFEDNNNYLGFNRLTKIFTKSDFNGHRSHPNSPAVVHNVEAMNSDYTRYISKGLIYGTGEKNTEELEEFASINEVFVGEKSFAFNPAYSGKRSISTNATCKVFENGKKLQSEGDNVYYFAQGKSYEIVVSNDTAKNVTLSLDVASYFGGSTYLSSNESYIYKFSSFSGFKNLYSSNSNVKFFDLDGNSFGVANGSVSNQYVIVKQETSSSFYADLKLKDPEKFVDKGNHKYSANMVKNGVMEFTNPNNSLATFVITVSGSANLSFYIDTNVEKTPSSIVNSGQYKTYKIILNASERIFVQSSSSTSISITEDTANMYWFVNNQKYTGTVLEVKQSSSYTIVLKRLINGTYYEVDAEYLQSEGSWVTSNGYKYTISGSATIGNKVVISSLGLSITLKVIPSATVSCSVSNGNVISVYVSIYGLNTYSNSCYYRFKLTSSSGKTKTYSVKASVYNGSQSPYSLSESESNDLGLSAKFEFIGMEINGVNYGAKYFSISGVSKVFNALYSSGNGSGHDPYIISCERQLKNISKYPSDHYELSVGFSLSGLWNPISGFGGVLDGKNKTISNLTLNCTGNGYCGLFKENEGTIKNLKINNASIQMNGITSDAYTITCGYIAGYNGYCGTISNCEVINSKMNLKFSTVTFGFVAGKNFGVIDSCTSTTCTLTSSYIAGGIVGINELSVSNCTVTGINIKYVEKDGVSGEVGGIVGNNVSGATVKKSSAKGSFYWHVEVSNNSDESLCPWLGKIIGHNNGTISECTSDINPDLEYGWRAFLWWSYDQGGHSFRGTDGLVG